MRVPCVMWGPGIPAGTECDQLATTLDLLPTIAALTGSKLPEDRRIDGVDISNLLADPTAESPRKEFLYYASNGNLEGIRQGDWKLLRREKRRKKGEPKIEGPPQYTFMLFDLSKDIGEKDNLAEEKPDLVTKLRRAHERARRGSFKKCPSPMEEALGRTVSSGVMGPSATSMIVRGQTAPSIRLPHHQLPAPRPAKSIARVAAAVWEPLPNSKPRWRIHST